MIKKIDAIYSSVPSESFKDYMVKPQFLETSVSHISRR